MTRVHLYHSPVVQIVLLRTCGTVHRRWVGPLKSPTGHHEQSSRRSDVIDQGPHGPVIKKDLMVANMDLHDVWKYAQNKTIWHHVMDMRDKERERDKER